MPARTAIELTVRGGENRAVPIREPARNRDLEAYESRVNDQIYYPLQGVHTSYRRIFELQAEQMARVILGEARLYRPFVVR